MDETERSLKFAKLIKDSRQKLNLSYHDVQDRTMISASYIHHIEQGERPVPAKIIVEKLATGLELSPEQISDFTKV